MTPRVIVLGGSGFFGRYLVDDLMRTSTAEVVAVGRRPARVGHRFVQCDVEDETSLRAALRGASVVVHCAGPFQGASMNPLDTAIDLGVHYVDISEDRRYARAVQSRSEMALAQGVTVLNGCSVVPTLSIAVANLLARPLDQVSAVRTFAAPGTGRTRGPAMFRTMLGLAGRPCSTVIDGHFERSYAWSDPEWVFFPPPVGRRLVYSVGGMADVDAMPGGTGAKTVEFKAGCEHAWLNRLLAAASRVQRSPARISESWLLAPARLLSSVAGFWGTDQGAAMFAISGLVRGQPVQHWVAIVAERDGGRIPIIPAAIAVQSLLDGSMKMRGVVPPGSWLDQPRLVSGFRHRGLRLVHLERRGTALPSWA